MKAMCSSCDDCCDNCDCNCCPRDKPKPVFLIYTLIVNVPLLVAGVVIGASNVGNNSCAEPAHSNLPTYLLVQAACCLIHIIFAIYFYWRVLTPKPGQENWDFVQRTSHLCWKDCGVFFYFFGWAFSIAWAFVGSSWSNSAVGGGWIYRPISNCPSSSADTLLFMVSAMVTISLVWAFVAVLVFAITLCCECASGVNRAIDRRTTTKANERRSREEPASRQPGKRAEREKPKPKPAPARKSESYDEDEGDDDDDASSVESSEERAPPPKKKKRGFSIGPVRVSL